MEFKRYIDPDPSVIGDNIDEFLDYLASPTIIQLTGSDNSRRRAFVTLLHGNEPSGLYALYRWLKSGLRPAVNILCIIPSVKAAKLLPLFSNRVVPGNRDLNRCFKPPYFDEPGRLAQAILVALQQYNPEAVIDMHNTSGSGPAFAVAPHNIEQNEPLTSFFCQRLIITHLRLGSLMEISEHQCPTVTIECGGRLDNESHESIGGQPIKITNIDVKKLSQQFKI